MDCWHCGTELIWGGDHDLEEEFYGEDHAYDFVTNLSCPKCQAYVEVHHRNCLLYTSPSPRDRG